jgi:peptidoglycan/LPS O-acetylase OafA/YrhL
VASQRRNVAGEPQWQLEILDNGSKPPCRRSVIMRILAGKEVELSNTMLLTRSAPRTLGEAINSGNGFNLVRLIAALLVVVYHCFSLNPAHPGLPDPVTRLLAPASNLGAVAVGVFFMISGLFISRSWMHDPHVLRFLLRRVVRIVPGLLVCVTLTTLIAVAFFSDTGWAGVFSSATWRYVFGSATLHGLQTVIPPEELRIAGVLNGQDINGPLWTLYWEGRMYVMLALLGASAILPMRTWLMGASIFLLAAAGLWPQVLGGYIWNAQMWPLFLIGILLCTLASSIRVGPAQVICALLLAGLSWARWMDTNSTGLTFFGATLILASAALWVGTARFQGQAYFQRNDYSYGVYIYHWPVILMLRAVMPGLNEITLLLCALAVVLPLAMLSWHWIESPALHFTRRRLHHSSRMPEADIVSTNASEAGIKR